VHHYCKKIAAFAQLQVVFSDPNSFYLLLQNGCYALGLQRDICWKKVLDEALDTLFKVADGKLKADKALQNNTVKININGPVSEVKL
jgi:hypothetical protein